MEQPDEQAVHTSPLTPPEDHAPTNLVDLLKVQKLATSYLEHMRNLAQKYNLETIELDLIDDVLLRVENSRFSIAVVGEFKRGKSTFVNALMGEPVLPADVLPTTATLNRVTYGVTPFVQIVLKGNGQEPERIEEIKIDQLADYVTKLTEESEARAANIKEAIIHYPVEYLRKNVDIYDTPGLNDDDTMTSVTLEVIPKIDAAILVIMPESPFSGYEGDFLNKLLLNDLGRVIFVVNAIDRIRREADRERLKKSISDRIKASTIKKAEELFGKDTDEARLHTKRIGEPRIFALSSYDALEAKQSRDDKLLQESGFKLFEENLEKFLTRERGLVTLQVLVGRVSGSGAKILQKLNMQMNAAQMQQQEFEAAYKASSDEVETMLRQMQEQLRRIDATAEKTQQKVRPMLSRLGDELKQAATLVIDEMPMTPADLDKNKKTFIEKLGKKVADGVEHASKVMAERVQFVIQQELEIEIGRVSDFATAVDRSLHSVDMQFNKIRADSMGRRGGAGEDVAAAVSAVSLWFGGGGIWSGYREAGLKGALVGGVTSYGTLLVGTKIAALGLTALGVGLTLPVTLVVLTGLGLASIFTGKLVTRQLFGYERVETFKQNYKQAVLAQVDQQFQAQYPMIERQFDDHIADTFAALKRSVQREIGSSLDQTQKTLDDLRNQRERNVALGEVELRELEQTRVEVQRMVSKAHALSDQLRDIVVV